MRKVINAYNKIEEILLSASIIISVVILFANVIVRKVFNSSIYGVDEIVRILFIWMSWIGVSIAERENEHVTIDILTERLVGMPKMVIDIISSVITTVILMTLGVTGYFITIKYAGFGSVTPMFQLPTWILYVVVPIGCGVMALRVIAKIVEIIKAGPSEGGIAL